MEYSLMLNAVEEFPGQIKQLENYIAALEKEVDMLRERCAQLEAQVYGGTTK
jgi:predicted RNase H-like nuclease (RuvC/YqgF family)